MVRIGYHASHEQFTPRDLVEHAKAAEAAGFDCVMSSDHFAPWSRAQGQSGFAWSWLGAAMQATSLPFGLITVPGGWRYHPTIVAQAAATLSQMFPDRFNWLALGSGEKLNEHIVGAGWPDKRERNNRLRAGADIVRDLLAGEEVTRSAVLSIDSAKLYTKPSNPIALVAAALSPETAKWAGEWADGLLTVHQPPEALRALIAAFREGGGAGKPLMLQVHVSYDTDIEKARGNAFEQWRANAVGPEQAENLASPEAFEAATAEVKPGDMDKHVRISADLDQHAAWIAEYVEMGFEEIYLHNVGRNQSAFIAAFGKGVLPKVRG